MDGYVTIGTKLDTKGLEKDLNKAQRELLKLDSEAEKLQEKKIFVELDLREYYKSIEEVKKSTDRDLYLYGKTDEQAQQILETEEQTLRNIDEQYAKQLQKLSLINAKIKENADAQENMKGQVTSLNEELGKSSGQLDFGDIDNNAKKVGNSIGSIVKRVIRWGLALLGVRTALSLLSRSFSTLSQYNEDLANRVESMRLLLATALEPIINWLVNMAEKLLQIIAGILNMLFGIDLYARASQLSANKMAKGFGGASKSAKELKKQLAGFDEMNVLTEPTESSGGGGGGGGFNLQKPDWDNWKMPGWLKWIMENWDLILGAIGLIGGALVALKLGLDPLLGAGIGLILAGIVNLIIDIIDFIKDPSWEKFKSLIDDFLIDIGMIIAGIGLLTGNWIPLVIGLVIMLAGVIIRYWDQIWGFLKQVGAEFKREAMVVWEFIKGIWNKFKEFHEMIFWGAVNYVMNAIEKIKKFFTSLWNFIKNIFNTANNFIAGVITGVINHFNKLWDSIINSAKWCWDKVKSVFNGITSFFSGIISKIIGFFSSVGTKVGDAIGKAFKSAINGVLKAVESILNTPIKAINSLISKVNELPGVSLKKLSTFSFPRLAKGGIINQPGRGVMVGGAIGGEAGREGVIPLTDSQQMALLGEAIGKYITINANITNTMNGRVISRELQKIQNANDFAYNS